MTSDSVSDITTSKWTSVTFLALAEVLALSLWFSATALIPDLRAEFDLSDAQASLFSSSVSIGFVIGTFISALFSLADRISPRFLFTICVIAAALANCVILVLDPTSIAPLFFRLLTGMAMAGIYPVGMKMMATWARGDAGLLVGLLVGALTLGSAMPHLLNIFQVDWLDWRFTLLGSSGLALISALLVQFVRLGSPIPKAPPFEFSLALEAWRNKAIRLANFGYFGHMWELYAMWAWIGIFLLGSFQLAGYDEASLYANLTTFATIGIGAIGSLFAGRLADRLGRTTVTMSAMLVSGSCAALIGLFYGSSPAILILICLVWGLSVIADSAQFSTCIIELSPANMIGTMLTIQTCTGFLISLATIHLVPVVASSAGWEFAFLPLAIGPLLGTYAMWRLRYHPEAYRLAGGKK